jgi:hypothetical protein
MQSRRRSKRSPTLPLVVLRKGVKEIIQVPRDDTTTVRAEKRRAPAQIRYSELVSVVQLYNALGGGWEV